MRERALIGAMFGVGVVTAFVAGLELGLVEVRRPAPERGTMSATISQAAKPAPAWPPPSAALAPNEAAARAEPRPEAAPRGDLRPAVASPVEPVPEAERHDVPAAAPRTDTPAAPVPSEASRMARVLDPAPASRSRLPEVPAAPSNDIAPGKAASPATLSRPPSAAGASPPRADAVTNRLAAQPGTSVPPVRARTDVRSLPLVDVPAAPPPRAPLAADIAPAHAPARETPAIVPTASLEPLTASSSVVPVARAHEAAADVQPIASLRELSQARSAGVVGPPLARATGEPPAAPRPVTSRAELSRSATAPAVELPKPAPSRDSATTANLSTPPLSADEPSTRAPDRPRKSATPSRKRPRADIFRSRASLGRPTRAVPRRGGVTVHYGAPPASRGSGPILIRIHRARDGRIRTTRMPVY